MRGSGRGAVSPGRAAAEERTSAAETASKRSAIIRGLLAAYQRDRAGKVLLPSPAAALSSSRYSGAMAPEQEEGAARPKAVTIIGRLWLVVAVLLLVKA